MKIVILDGYALNPGDLSYDCLKAFGELTVYEGTDTEEAAIARIGDAEIVLINKVSITENGGAFSGADIGIVKYHFELGAGNAFEWA